MGNWLNFKNPRRLAGKLAELKKKLEQSPFASVMDPDAELKFFGRKDASTDPESHGQVGHTYPGN